MERRNGGHTGTAIRRRKASPRKKPPRREAPVETPRVAFYTRISTDELLEFIIESPLSEETLHLRGSVFFVPYGCSF